MTDPKFDPRSEEGAQVIYERAIGVARMNFENHGFVAPVVLGFVQKNPNTLEKLADGQFGIVAIPASFRTDDEKDLFSATARKVLEVTDAFACMFVSESWALNVTDPAIADEQYRKYGSISKSPLRKEIVLASFEHCARRKPLVAQADIIREIPLDESSPGKLAEFVIMDGPSSFKGRFVSLLPGARGN